MIHSAKKWGKEGKKIRKTCRWWPQECIHKLRLSKEIVSSDTKAICYVLTLLKNKESHTLLILFESFHTVSSSLSCRELELYATSWPNELQWIAQSLGWKLQFFFIWCFRITPSFNLINGLVLSRANPKQRVPTFGGFCDLKEAHYAKFTIVGLYLSTQVHIRPTFTNIS